MGTFAFGISGASGAIYGFTLLEYLVKKKHKIFLTISREGQAILKEEVNVSWIGNEKEVNQSLKNHFGEKEIEFFSPENLHAPISSGSVFTDGMVIVPCSFKTVSAIRHGTSSNLIERAADVTLKEGRPLFIVPRETPLSSIHLENLYSLAKMGVRIIPAMPGFYNQPKTIDDLVRFVVGRILDSMKITHSLYQRWDSVEQT
ncbi:MAG TPA: flavin prenyltransferase UbiX [Nitrospiria bacterium]|jgi:4-hydroxy-3-polyprenylbenzoate decarboxylase